MFTLEDIFLVILSGDGLKFHGQTSKHKITAIQLSVNCSTNVIVHFLQKSKSYFKSVNLTSKVTVPWDAVTTKT